MQEKTPYNKSMEKNSVPPYNQSLLYAAELFTKALHETSRKIYKEMGFGISHEHYIILETVHLNPGIIQIDIAKKILMKRSYVFKLLGELEQMGYVRKENGIRGKKQIVIKNFVTESGEELYKKVQNFLIGIVKRYQSEYNKDRDITEKLLDMALVIKKEFNLKF